MYQADDLVDEMREALRRAESFGDICGIIVAQLAYGTALLRASRCVARRGDRCARQGPRNIQKHKVHDHRAGGRRCRPGDRRRPQRANATKRSMNFAPCLRYTWTGGTESSWVAPVRPWSTLLIERGSTDDLAEAHRIVDHWQARRPAFPHWTCGG